MRDLLGAKAVSEMLDDLPEAILAALGVAVFVIGMFALCLVLA